MNIFFVLLTAIFVAQIIAGTFLAGLVLYFLVTVAVLYMDRDFVNIAIVGFITICLFLISPTVAFFTNAAFCGYFCGHSYGTKTQKWRGIHARKR
jgi:hypothetical protein